MRWRMPRGPRIGMPLRSVFAAVAVLGVFGCGCETVGSRSHLGSAAGGSRVDPRVEAARSITRAEQLEADLRRLQEQVNGLSETQQHVLSQAESRVAQSRQESLALRSDLESLRRELATLKTEQQQLRGAVDDLPARVSRAVAAARPPSPPAGTASRPRSASAVGYEHVVEAGQTLSEIARAYGVRMESIVQENNLKDAGSIRVGQKLFIPKP